jgi:hypothetical protein
MWQGTGKLHCSALTVGGLEWLKVVIVACGVQVSVWQCTHPDGLEVFHYPTGQVEGHFADGRKEVIFADGAARSVTANG